MSTSQEKPAEFVGLRAVLWPVHNYEMKKFLPMALMMLCILFNYTILRDTKDTLVVNAPGSGAGALAFVKLYGTTPMAVLFMIIYAKLANVLSRENLFYAAILPFLLFFMAFAFVIYPNVEYFHMSTETMSRLQGEFPRLYWFIAVIGNWSYSIFYIFSELWGSVVISLLFWQFANEIVRVKEAKRFYGLFGLIGNVGLIISGYTIIHFSKVDINLAEGVDPFESTVKYLMGAVTLAGFFIVGIYWWMNRNVLTDKVYYDPEEGGAKKVKKKKPKLGIGESFKYILSSPYLGCIALVVLAYGVSINLVETVWKGQIKIRFPNKNDYQAFMGQFSMITGIVTLVLMIVGNNILRRLPWRAAALITPIMILVTSVLFFGLIIYSNNFNPFDPFMGTTMVMAAVVVGLIQNVLSKSTKYSLFDPTKEMAYIPLDQELKVKGKAAVDVIGGRAGKAGGGAITSGLLIAFAGSTLAQLVPVLAVIVIGVVILWIVSIISLAKKFYALTAEQEGKAAAEASAEAL
jgi:AAA family ATP:ADP antiporter